MRTTIYVFLIVLTGCALMACNPTKQEVGAGTGAVVGGGAAALITHGNPWWTVGGAAVGAVAGSAVGKNMEENDEEEGKGEKEVKPSH